MKKKLRFFSMALAILMILPMLAAIPVSATDPSTYDLAEAGQLLRSVNFKADYWNTEFASSSNSGADIAVSDDGTSVKLTVNTTSSSRAMWGGFYPDDEDEDEYEAALGDLLPMKAGAKYTMVFDLKLGHDNVGFGIQVDGDNALIIRGNGQSRWLKWNNLKIDETSDNNEKWNYHTASGASKRDKNTYAVTVDYDAKTMELWVVDVSDGAFYFVRSITCEDESVWTSSYFRCRLTARKLDGTANSSYTAEVSNLNIYKGNALKQLSGNSYLLSYWSHLDGDELFDVNFTSTDYLSPALSTNNGYDDLDVTVDGGTVTFTSLSTDSKRGIWGDTLPADFFPLSAGVKYTVYFSLTMEAGMKCVYFPDGTQGIAIIQNSTYTKYQSYSDMSGTEANWANKTDYGSSLKKFAVELDYDTGTLTLYGRNQNGTYCFINEATGLTFEDSALGVYFWAGNTAGKSVTVSNMWIEKGLTVKELDKAAIGFTAYQAQADNALLQTVNFNREGWNPGFADNNNKGADVTVLSDNSVQFLLHNGDNYRAMWGAKLVDKLPLLGTINGTTGAEYTFVFDVTFGNDEMRVGIMPDADNALMIQGNGAIQWFKWNTQQGAISETWTDHTDVAGSSQTFAVVMDYDACSFGLYVKRSNGSFEYVTSREKSYLWDTYDTMNFRFRVDRKTGTPDDTYTVTVSNVKIYKGLEFGDRHVMETATGAAVRLSDPTGIRFTGYIGKDYLDELRTEYGSANVKIGMVITPTEYLTDNSLDFTMAALDGCGAIPAGKKYVQVEAKTILESEDGNAYKINCVLSDVNSANYTRAFSAIVYVEINGSTYYYSNYNETDHSRSIAVVAEAALLDVSDTQHDEYQYEVEIEYTTKYSPYTEVQRNALAGFRGFNSFSVMSYNIEMYDGTWEDRTPGKVIQTITDHSPDIVGLQEIDSEWDTTSPTNLSALTSNGYTRVKGATKTASTNTTGGNKTVKSRNDIYYKTSKFNALNSGYEIFRGELDGAGLGVDADGADNDRDKMYRHFTWALLEEKTSGKKILAICTHLHYRLNTDDTASNDENMLVRKYEVRLLLAWIEAQTFNYDCIVVFGDMNAHYLEAVGGRGRQVIDVYRNEGDFLVTRDSAIIKGDTGGTLDKWNADTSTHRSTREEYIYDYIFTKGNCETVYFTVVDNKIDNGKYPSDHLPVMARIICY